MATNRTTEIQEPLNIHYTGVSELMAAIIGMAQALKRFLIAKRRAREQPLSQSTAAPLPVTRAVAVTSDDLRVTVCSGKRKRDLTGDDGTAVKRHRGGAAVETAPNPETVIASRCSKINEKDDKVTEVKNVQGSFRESCHEWRPFGKPCSPSLAIAPKTNICKPVAVVTPSVVHQNAGQFRQRL